MKASMHSDSPENLIILQRKGNQTIGLLDMVFSRKVDRTFLRYTEDTDITAVSLKDGKTSVQAVHSVLEKAMILAVRSFVENLK